MSTYLNGVEALQTATISSGTSLSNAIDIASVFKSDARAASLFGFVMPSGWNAAGLTILASYDNGVTFVPMKSLYDGTEITYVVNASGYFPLPNPQIFAAVPMIKLQSGTTAAPVNQAADRAIQLVLRST